MKLSAKKIESLTRAGKVQPGFYGDGGNLYLSVRENGASWVFVYRDRVDGKRREMGLGALADVAAPAARGRASGMRKLLAEGKDPLQERKAERAAAVAAKAAALASRTTLRMVMDEMLPVFFQAYRNDKHKYQWRRSLETYAADLLPLPPCEITSEHVLKALQPIWLKKRETAGRLRCRIEKLWDCAKAKKLCSGENPALLKLLQPNLPNTKSRRKRVMHHPAVDHAEMLAFMRELRALSSVSASALEFTVLTAARTSEVRFMKWKEIDFKNKLWTVPAERIKMGVVHRVPLSDAAITILKSKHVTDGKASDYVFVNPQSNEPLSDQAMLMCLRGLRPTKTVHGFRSTFRDWVADETHFPREVAEKALAHGLEDQTEAAYFRSDLYKKRRELMDAWSRFLISEATNNVIALAS